MLFHFYKGDCDIDFVIHQENNWILHKSIGSIVAKKTNTNINLDYDNGAQTNYMLQLFYYIFVIMFMLCYWYDQKCGIAFAGGYNFI